MKHEMLNHPKVIQPDDLRTDTRRY